jgi:hypothetical protein
MKPWTRDDTKDWIHQLENRLDDLDHYLKKTADWCEEYGIDNDHVVFMCSFLTCIWVSTLREEPITTIELKEILGIEDWPIEEDKVYELNPEWLELEHYEFLERVVEALSKDEDE